MILTSFLMSLALSLQTAPPAQLPATAADTPQPPAVPASATSSADNEMVCREEMATGRRIPTRVCRTRAQMRADALRGEEALRRAQDNHRRSQD